MPFRGTWPAYAGYRNDLVARLKGRVVRYERPLDAGEGLLTRLYAMMEIYNSNELAGVQLDLFDRARDLPNPASKTARLLSVSLKLSLHHLHQSLRRIRLSQKHAIVRQILVAHLPRTRRYDDLNVRPLYAHLLRESQPVRLTRHVDVREHNANPRIVVQGLKRF